MLKSSGQNDYHNFRLSYWDWRNTIQTEENSPFKVNRLGNTVMEDNMPIVKGDLFNNGWNTFCWSTDSDIGRNATPVCDPTFNTQRLQRCPFPSKCAVDSINWPSIKDVNDALGKNIYDTSPFSPRSSEGFRNFFEGFLKVDDCVEDALCDTDDDAVSLSRKLHNTVREYNPIQLFFNVKYANPSHACT